MIARSIVSLSYESLIIRGANFKVDNENNFWYAYRLDNI